MPATAKTPAVKDSAVKDSVSVAKSEIGKLPIEFEWKGHHYTVPAMEDWPYEAQEAMESQFMARMVRAVLKPRDMIKFMETEPKTKDLAEFVEALFRASGVDLGE